MLGPTRSLPKKFMIRLSTRKRSRGEKEMPPEEAKNSTRWWTIQGCRSLPIDRGQPQQANLKCRIGQRDLKSLWAFGPDFFRISRGPRAWTNPLIEGGLQTIIGLEEGAPATATRTSEYKRIDSGIEGASRYRPHLTRKSSGSEPGTTRRRKRTQGVNSHSEVFRKIKNLKCTNKERS